MRIPPHSGHSFRLIPATRTDTFRPVIPTDSGRLIQAVQTRDVSRAIPTEGAMPRLDSPLEAAKTIFARSTCRRGSVRDRTQDSRIRRSPRSNRNFLVVVAMDTNIGVHGIVG